MNFVSQVFVFPQRWWGCCSLSTGELLLIICLLTAEAKRGFWRCDLSLEGNISFQRGSQQIDLSFIHGCGPLVLFCSGPTKAHEYYSLWSGHLLLRSAKLFLALASRVCVNSSELIWPELLGGVNVVWQLACWIPWGGKLWLPLDALIVHTAEGWATALLDPRAMIYPCSSAQLPSATSCPHQDGVESCEGKREKIGEQGSGQPGR